MFPINAYVSIIFLAFFFNLVGYLKNTESADVITSLYSWLFFLENTALQFSLWALLNNVFPNFFVASNLIWLPFLYAKNDVFPVNV